MTRHSVILTCYNGEKYILEAIESVLSQLDHNDEMIVVDDGSTDASRDLLANFSDSRIRVVFRSENGGISAARNDAIALVQGIYVSFIDHDDRWEDGRVADFEKIVKEFPAVEVVHGRVMHFYSDLKLARKYRMPETKAAVLPGTVTLSSALLRQVGLFNTSITCGEFVDFMARAKSLSSSWYSSNKVYLQRRIHGENYTLTHVKDTNGYLAVVREHLLRKQRPAGNSKN